VNSVISVLVRQETATWGGCDLGGDGFGEGDYGWGVRVRRPFGARGMSSVRYGIRLGDLKENWFLCFPIKHSTHTPHLRSIVPNIQRHMAYFAAETRSPQVLAVEHKGAHVTPRKAMIRTTSSSSSSSSSS
jgi:hypothetical protein